ncbi:hypothetical protein V9T40_003354 [Parthenolecanium corni]|uniref:Uncharacterized protein n=1 Tax=Parthenolecanium corni TaxID=536013 RepID=A0AAN9TV58_9HEMI
MKSCDLEEEETDIGLSQLGTKEKSGGKNGITEARIKCLTPYNGMAICQNQTSDFNTENANPSTNDATTLTTTTMEDEGDQRIVAVNPDARVPLVCYKETPNGGERYSKLSAKECWKK